MAVFQPNSLGTNTQTNISPRTAAPVVGQSRVVTDGIASTAFYTASAPLGALAASATSVTKHLYTASAPLGGLSSSATSITTHPHTAAAPLGSLAATAALTVTNPVPSASAPLGELIASAAYSVTPGATGGSTASVNRHFLTPPKPNPKPLPQREWLEPTRPAYLHFASASASLGGLRASARSQITFSILDDDMDALLLL